MDGIRTLDELQEKLDGVFDLNQADDCQKVIETLLRTIRDRDEAAQKAQDDLKMLALLVMNESLEARIKAKEIMTVSKKGKSGVGEFILKMFNSMIDATKLSNKQIIEEVTSKIWGSLDMSSRESAVLGELLLRSKKAFGKEKVGERGKKDVIKPCKKTGN